MMDNILSRLDSIERMLADLLAAKDLAQEYYSTTDVAKVLQKAEWTVREWCRLGRVKACKRRSGRGRAKEWMVSHEELKRIKSEGLLPRE